MMPWLSLSLLKGCGKGTINPPSAATLWLNQSLSGGQSSLWRFCTRLTVKFCLIILFCKRDDPHHFALPLLLQGGRRISEKSGRRVGQSTCNWRPIYFKKVSLAVRKWISNQSLIQYQIISKDFNTESNTVCNCSPSCLPNDNIGLNFELKIQDYNPVGAHLSGSLV